MPTPFSFVPTVNYRFTINVEDQEVFHTSNIVIALAYARLPNCKVWDNMHGKPF
jgi:hypothetical protein